MSGLLALFDDVVALAKVAAASLDDAAAQAAKAGSKAAGIVIDDAAVTPRYVVGFAAERELPIVGKIAWGSIKNKLLYLLPAALLLSAFAPWAITPLLMIGGAFLCFEGYEKVHGWLHPHAENATPTDASALDQTALEDEKVAGAIRTDLILSAEIMAISLATIDKSSIITQAITLAVVALLITAAVYGAVALIVKADDVGVALAQSQRPISGFADVLRRREAKTEPSAADKRLSPLTRAIGRGLVSGMPPFLRVLSVIGTLAMLWVGGGIIVHSLAEYGLGAIEHGINGIGAAIGSVIPLLGGLVSWLIGASISGVIGLAIGWIVERGVHMFKR
jgi:uncharacterized protein